MDDRSRALAKSRDELRPLAEWFWDALDASPIRSRNELAKRAGYDKNTVYALFEGQRLIGSVQARDLADALGADLADLDKLWTAVRRPSHSSASGGGQGQGTALRALKERQKGPEQAMPITVTPGEYVPWMTPAVDQILINRRALTSSVTGLLMKNEVETAGLTTALIGAGGFGKTTLAVQVCSQPEVRQRFPGGLLWATIGQERQASEIAGIINDLCRHLSGNRPDFANADQAGYYFGRLLDARPATLVVIDDIWDTEQLRPFRYGGETARQLVISRQPDLLPDGAQTVIVDEMRPEESRTLLCAGLPDLPGESIEQLLRLTGNWPLLLALTNGFLRRSIQPVNAARIAAHKLEEDGPTALDIRVGASREKAVSRTIQASIQLLSDSGLAASAALVLLVPLLRRAPVLNRIAIAASLAVAISAAGWLAWSVTPLPWTTVAFGRRAQSLVSEVCPVIVPEIPNDSSDFTVYCTYVGEGTNVSVAVSATKSGVLNFHGAGKIQASTEPFDMQLQRMLGHLPHFYTRSHSRCSLWRVARESRPEVSCCTPM